MGKLAELERKKQREGLTPEEEKLYNFLKEQKKEREKILKTEEKPKQPEKKRDLLEGMVETAGFFERIAKEAGRGEYGRGGEAKQPEKSTGPPGKKQCPACGSEIWEGAKICPVCKTDLRAFEEQERLAGLGIGGKIKEKLKGKGKEYKEKTWGEVKKRLGIGESHLISGLKFGILSPIAILSVFGVAVPVAEGAFGVVAPPQVQTFQALLWKSLPVMLAGIFGVIIPPSVILGKYGVNFDVLNKICMFSIAGSAAMWGGSNILLPAVKTFMPEEYALLMCLMKYRGNMQVCIAQNQTVRYKKTGTYETLKVDMGVVTPSQTIPPPDPVPDLWDSNPYDLPLTLSNKNPVGSTYDIKVYEINISASPDVLSKDFVSASEIFPDLRKKPIKPGGYAIVTARFNKTFYPGRPINCKQYTYFHINVTTEQIGGGSAKFGLIESDEGMDNQNFMYFFDPDIKTEPGPLDIYVYTLPFVIPATMREVEGPDFGVYIKIKNKGKGTAIIDGLTLIQVNKRSDIPSPISITNCKLIGNSSLFNDERSNDYCPPGKTGNCILITGNAPIKKDQDFTFRCNGEIVSEEPFYGKTTDFISVNASYKYLQTSEEQIACIKSEGMLDTFCRAHNETTCKQASMCKWCYGCLNNRASYFPDGACIPADADCGYHCVKDKCNAECGSDEDCGGITFCGYDCTCTYSVPEII
ncbi:MAG: hypothetical protein QMD36_01380 [Candidatus Aenigmarchaeota archaeon]|nr:hypothetical protein [Candidatus Aenigmarchaeota archaeon]